jgi:hypothetical protein
MLASSRYDLPAMNLSNISPLASDDELENENEDNEGNDDSENNDDFFDSSYYNHEMLSVAESARELPASNNENGLPLPLTETSNNYIELSTSNSTFIDCEVGSKPLNLSFTLDNTLDSSEFIAISIYCIPNCRIEDDFIANIEKKRILSYDFVNLSFRLIYFGNITDPNITMPHSSSSSSTAVIPLKSSVFNGEYCLTLANRSEKLKKGVYLLNVTAIDNNVTVASTVGSGGEVFWLNKREYDTKIHIQTLKINFSICKEVEATAIIANSPITGKILRRKRRKRGVARGVIGAEGGEYLYYRFVMIEKGKTLRFKVNPCKKKEKEKESVPSQQHLNNSNNKMVRFNNSSSTSSSSAVQKVEDEEIDLSLFISNKYCGLFPVSKETAVWSSHHTVNHQILEILPNDIYLSSQSDDVASNTFIIGVYCNESSSQVEERNGHSLMTIEEENDDSFLFGEDHEREKEDREEDFEEIPFEFMIEVLDDQPITAFSAIPSSSSVIAGGSGIGVFSSVKNNMKSSPSNYHCHNIQLSFNQFQHFSVEIDPTESSLQTLVSVQLLKNNARIPPLYERYLNIQDFKKQKINSFSSSHFIQGISSELPLLHDIIEKVFFVCYSFPFFFSSVCSCCCGFLLLLPFRTC